ncbi:MAG: WD40 repeat domain-containing protein [bacterium]
MKSLKIFIYFSFFSLFFTTNINSTKYPEIEKIVKNYPYQITTSWDTIEGIVQLQNGMIINENSVATLGIIQPVEQEIFLQNNALLELQRDLKFDANSYFNTENKSFIKGNGNAFLFRSNQNIGFLDTNYNLTTQNTNFWEQQSTENNTWYDVDFHPNNLFLSTPKRVWLPDSSPLNSIKMYEIQQNGDLNEIWTEIIPGAPNVIKFSPDGLWLAIGYPSWEVAANQIIQMYDVGFSGSLTFTWNQSSNGVGVNCLDFSPDGQWLATGGEVGNPGEIEIFDIGLSGSLTSTWLQVFGHTALCLAFSPDGLWLAAGGESGTAATRIQMFDVGLSGSLTNTWNQNYDGDHVYSIAFSPDGKWLAVGGDDFVGPGTTEIKIFDVGLSGSLTETWNQNHPNSACRSIAFSPDGLELITGGQENGFLVYDVGSTGSLTLKDSITTGEPIRKVVVSDNGKFLATEYDTDVSQDLTVYRKFRYHLEEPTMTIQSSNIEFLSDTIIDGNGKEIIIANGSQIIIDSNVTVTLKNLILKTPTQSPSMDCIKTYVDSKLSLQNVMLSLGGDTEFSNGQLFIHDDVIISGTSSFIYSSTQNLIIDKDSTLVFDLDTIFTYSPHDTNRDLIIMQDNSSQLFLNGCTILTTPTTMRLTKGTLIIDDKVTFNLLFPNSIAQQNPTFFTSPSFYDIRQTTSFDYAGSLINDFAFYPGGKFLATGGNAIGSEIEIYLPESEKGLSDFNVYAFDGNDYIIFSIGITSTTFGDFLSYFSADYLKTFKILSDGQLQQTDSKSISGSISNAVDYSSDSKWLAIGFYHEIRIYRLNSDGTLTQEDSISISYRANSISFSSDGKYLAVSQEGYNTVNFYSVANDGTLALINTQNYAGTEINSLEFSKDGKFIAFGGDNSSNEIEIYTLTTNCRLTDTHYANYNGTEVNSISFHPDSQQLAVCGNGTNEIEVYSVASDGTLSLLDSQNNNLYIANSLKYSSNGKFLAAGGNGTEYALTEAYNVNSDGTLTYLDLIQFGNKDSAHKINVVNFIPKNFVVTTAGEKNNPGMSTLPTLETYRISEQDGLQQIAFINYDNLQTGQQVYSVDISNNGKFLACAGVNVNSNEVEIYSIKGLATIDLIESSDYGSTNTVYSLKFSPNNKFLAVGGNEATNEIEFLSLDLDGYITTTHYANYGGSIVYSLDFSPDGQFLAVGGDNSGNEIVVYFVERNGSLTLKDSQNYAGTEVYAVKFCPNGKYLAVGGNNSAIEIYSISQNGTLTFITSKNYNGTKINSISFSKYGQFMCVDGNGSTYKSEIYYIDKNGNITLVENLTFGGTETNSSIFSPDGKIIYIGGNNENYEIEAHPFKYPYEFSQNYFSTYNWSPYTPPTQPTITHNAITFGNSELGANHNLKINILNGALLQLSCPLNIDNV